MMTFACSLLILNILIRSWIFWWKKEWLRSACSEMLNRVVWMVIVSVSAFALLSEINPGDWVCQWTCIIKWGCCLWERRQIKFLSREYKYSLVIDFKKGLSALWTIPATKEELVIKLNGQSNLGKALTTAANSTIWGEPSTVSMSDFQCYLRDLSKWLLIYETSLIYV